MEDSSAADVSLRRARKKLQARSEARRTLTSSSRYVLWPANDGTLLATCQSRVKDLVGTEHIAMNVSARLDAIAA